MSSDKTRSSTAPTTQQLAGIDGLQLAPKATAKNEIDSNVKQIANEVLQQLAQEEAAVLRSMADGPGVRPSAHDYKDAQELALTLDLMPVHLAAPMLVSRLVEQPAQNGGQALGLTAAVLPLLRGRFDTNADWNESHDAQDLIRLCEIMTRDSAWYAGHRRLARIGQLEMKVRQLTEDYLEALGNEGDERAIATRQAFYADLGVEAA